MLCLDGLEEGYRDLQVGHPFYCVGQADGVGRIRKRIRSYRNTSYPLTRGSRHRLRGISALDPMRNHVNLNRGPKRHTWARRKKQYYGWEMKGSRGLNYCSTLLILVRGLGDKRSETDRRPESDGIGRYDSRDHLRDARRA